MKKEITSELFYLLLKRARHILKSYSIFNPELAFDLTTDFLIGSFRYFDEAKGELLPFFSSYIRKRLLGVISRRKEEKFFETENFYLDSGLFWVELKDLIESIYREVKPSEKLFLQEYFKELLDGGDLVSLSRRLNISYSTCKRRLDVFRNKARKNGLRWKA